MHSLPRRRVPPICRPASAQTGGESIGNSPISKRREEAKRTAARGKSEEMWHLSLAGSLVQPQVIRQSRDHPGVLHPQAVRRATHLGGDLGPGSAVGAKVHDVPLLRG